MIPELVLERLLDEIAGNIPVPADGADRVVEHLGTAVGPSRRPSPRTSRLLLVAAVLVVIGGIALVMHGTGGSSSNNASGVFGKTGAAQQPGTPVASSAKAKKAARSRAGIGAPFGAAGGTGVAGDAIGASPQGATGAIGVALPPQLAQGDEGLIGNVGPQGPAGAPGTAASAATPTTAPTQSPTAPIDGALVVKTGSLDLQVPHDELRPTFNRISTTVVGLGGYVNNQTASYTSSDPTGTMTVRVPVNLFEKAVSQINGLPDVKVLGDSETGKDVTAQYVNVQAQITALTTEEQSLLGLLAHAQDLNDILNLRGQVTGVQSEIDQRQGQINLLKNQASYSDLAITATEVVPKSVKKAQAAAHHASSPSGLRRSWSKATSGFASSVEWFIARSGGAIILLLAALVFVFGLRYLYPVLRRALM